LSANKAFLASLNKRTIINRLAGLLPTVGTFDTNPSNLERLTDNDFSLWTGEGVKSLPGTNGEVGRLTFDMGADCPILVIIWCNPHRNSGDGTIGMSVTSSHDNVTYSGSASGGISGISGDSERAIYLVFCHGRYIRITWTTSSVTVNPSVFHVKLSEVQALQLW
jgi:hypothetical protein